MYINREKYLFHKENEELFITLLIMWINKIVAVYKFLLNKDIIKINYFKDNKSNNSNRKIRIE